MVDDANYTEHTEDHSSDGYTARIRRNKIGPRDASAPPLTVTEFSLTDNVKGQLQNALNLSVLLGRQSMSDEALAQIIRDTFPEQVLTELKNLSTIDGATSSVYAIHNLPEITNEDLEQIRKSPEIPRDRNPDKAFQKALQQRTYAHLISKGVALALDLTPAKTHTLLRNPKNEGRKLKNGELHKHEESITLLSLVKADASDTRFTDFQSMTEDARAKDITLDCRENIALSDFPKVAPDWKKATKLEVEPIKEHEDLFEAHLAQHSQNVRTKSGTLILWANNGHIWHQARPGPTSGYGLTRVGFSMEANIGR